MPFELSAGSIPGIYRDLFEMLSVHGIEKLNSSKFESLFERQTLTKLILSQIWNSTAKGNGFLTRTEFYKALAFMALVQQGKSVDEKLLDNFVNREFPIPTLDPLNELEDRFIRLLREDQQKNELFFRYGDLCALDTIQVEVAPEKKGVIIRHFEYEVTSLRHKTKVSRRYNDFVALHELLFAKFPFRILPQLPPKKSVNVDKEFIEERRRSLKRYLEILSRHPILCEKEIIKFFFTFQGTSCGENMKATYKNTPDEFSCEPPTSSSSIDRIERHEEDSNAIRLFQASQTHLVFLHQQFTQIRTHFKSINERNFQIVDDLLQIEKAFQMLSSDTTRVERWATGLNDYWSRIQPGLVELPVEINAVADRLYEQTKNEDEMINDHLEMLIELLQGYRDLCKRFEEALQIEQKAIQKATQHQRRPLTSVDSASKNENTLDMIEKRNNHGLKCVQYETQLVYANLEAFVFILSSLGNIQCKLSADLFDVWKSFNTKISQLDQHPSQKKPVH